MILHGSGCIFKWGEPIEARVRAVYIVIDPPFFDAVAGVPVADEEPLVEALIAQLAIEAFHEAVIRHVVLGVIVCSYASEEGRLAGEGSM